MKIGLFELLIGIVGVFLVVTALPNLSSFAVAGTSGCTPEMGLKPLFGFYRCEWDQASSIVNPIYVPWSKFTGFLDAFNLNRVVVSCPNSGGTTSECQLNVRRTSAGLLEDFSSYEFRWSKCLKTNAASCAATSRFYVSVGTGDVTLTTFYPTDVIAIEIVSSRILKGPNEIYDIREVHKKYALAEYVSGAFDVRNPTDCSMSFAQSQKECVNCKTAADILGAVGLLPAGDNQPQRTGLLPGEYSNFLDAWVLEPTIGTGGSRPKHPLYGDVYCSMGRIYSFSTVQLRSTCYEFPAKYITIVECCPGERVGDKFCGDDFRFAAETKGCIVAGVPSIMGCDGQGSWKPISGTTQVHQATSCDSGGNCVYNTITAKCTPPNNGCSAGGTCVGTATDPTSWHCESGCTAGKDLDKNCYDDCTGSYVPGCKVGPDIVPGCADWDILCKVNEAIKSFFQSLGLVAMGVLIGLVILVIWGGYRG